MWPFRRNDVIMVRGPHDVGPPFDSRLVLQGRGQSQVVCTAGTSPAFTPLFYLLCLWRLLTVAFREITCCPFSLLPEKKRNKSLNSCCSLPGFKPCFPLLGWSWIKTKSSESQNVFRTLWPKPSAQTLFSLEIPWLLSKSFSTTPAPRLTVCGLFVKLHLVHVMYLLFWSKDPHASRWPSSEPQKNICRGPNDFHM